MVSQIAFLKSSVGEQSKNNLISDKEGDSQTGSMVNSGSFDSDEQGDRNAKAGLTQPHSGPDGTQSSSPVTASAATSCKAGFSQTADSGLPSVAHAIEPTPTKTEFNCNMPVENFTNLSSVDGEVEESVKSRIGEEKTSLCCSLPLDKIQGVLTSYHPPFAKSEDDGVKVAKQPARKLLCLYCERSFVSVNLRQKHVERIHSAKQNRRVSSRRQNQLTVTPCVYCDKLNGTENTLKDLFQHLINEHSSKYFGCLPCEDRFLTSSLLADHNAIIHHSHSSKNIKIRNASTMLEKATVNTPILEEGKIEVEEELEEIPVKITRSKMKQKPDEDDKDKKPAISNRKKPTKLKELRSKKLSVKSSRIALKRRESKRLQAIAKLTDTQKKKKTKSVDKKTSITGKTEPTNSTKLTDKVKTSQACINPYPEFDNFYRVKKITDHSIDNLKISSLTFDDVFDKAFFNRIKCNIEENLLHHIDGKLFKNEESESRISNFEKVSSVPQEIQNSNSENYGCEISLNAVTPVASLSLNSQFGEDFESQIEYGSKPSKKKSQPRKDEIHYKYVTRRKYQASILEHKENRDLSKLDMWTQLVIKKRQQKMLDDKKSAKEILEYTTCDEYKNKVKREELNRILDRRGPFEDLKEEASKKAALDKFNSVSNDNISEETFTEVREVLNEILNKVFAGIDVPGDAVQAEELQSFTLNDRKEDLREIPSYLNLRRSSSLPSDGEIDKSDQIALICSSQETENFELPTNQVRGKNELIELTGEWARCRMFICAACGAKLPNMRYLMDHKSLYHQNVWVQHYEFVGNQSELYRHLSIPALGKVGAVENSVQCKLWKRSDARLCTKCGKQCNSLGELHRHVLECGGDWTWMLARKKCKYRPYGAKSRRKRRGLINRVHNKQKTEPTEKKTYKKTFEGPRQRPSDADTIQRMLANLPAKRSTRKLISLQDGIYRARKTAQNVKQNKVKCGKMIYKSSTRKETNEKTVNATTVVLKPQGMSSRRSLRNLNKVLASRILDTNTNLNLKRKIKVLNDRRRTRQSIVEQDDIKEEVNDENLEQDSHSDLVIPSKSKIFKNDVETEVTESGVKKISPKPSPNNLKKKMSVKKLLTGKINIKSFFPVKKKKTRNILTENQNPQDTETENIEVGTTDIKTRSKRKSRELCDTEKKINEPVDIKIEQKKSRIENFSTLVRSLSMKKKKSEKKLDQGIVPKLPLNDENIEDKKAVVEQPEQNEELNLQSSQKIDKIAKKRKLKNSFRKVINKVKKLKIDNTENTAVKLEEPKSDTKNLKEGAFLEEPKPERLPVPIYVEKVVIPSFSEVKENSAELADLPTTSPIELNFHDTNENAPIPETIFKLELSNEKSLQAKGELDFDTQPEKPIETEIDKTADAAIETNDKTQPISIETSVKPKTVALISPNMKGKIRKPTRGLNDCIAMLTSKLQQKTAEESSTKADTFTVPSPKKAPFQETYVKTECILRIPTFRSQITHNEVEETALDLSTKSSRTAQLIEKDEPLRYSSKVVNNISETQDLMVPFFDRKYNRSSSSVDCTIEEVVENRIQTVSPSQAYQKKWNSVDDIIQQVVNDHHFASNIKLPLRSTVDDIIDFVVESKENPNIDFKISQEQITNKEVITRRIGSTRKFKNKKSVPEITTFEKVDATPVPKELSSICRTPESKKVTDIQQEAPYEMSTVLLLTENINNAPEVLKTSETTADCITASEKLDRKLNDAFITAEVSEVNRALKVKKTRKVGQVRNRSRVKKSQETKEKLLLETNIDAVLDVKEIESNPQLESITHLSVTSESFLTKSKEMEQLYNVDEPHLLENKPVTLATGLSDSEDDIPLAALLKVDEKEATVKSINTEIRTIEKEISSVDETEKVSTCTGENKSCHQINELFTETNVTKVNSEDNVKAPKSACLCKESANNGSGDTLNRNINSFIPILTPIDLDLAAPVETELNLEDIPLQTISVDKTDINAIGSTLNKGDDIESSLKEKAKCISNISNDILQIQCQLMSELNECAQNTVDLSGSITKKKKVSKRGRSPRKLAYRPTKKASTDIVKSVVLLSESSLNNTMLDTTKLDEEEEQPLELKPITLLSVTTNKSNCVKSLTEVPVETVYGEQGLDAQKWKQKQLDQTTEPINDKAIVENDRFASKAAVTENTKADKEIEIVPSSFGIATSLELTCNEVLHDKPPKIEAYAPKVLPFTKKLEVMLELSDLLNGTADKTSDLAVVKIKAKKRRQSRFNNKKTFPQASAGPEQNKSSEFVENSKDDITALQLRDEISAEDRQEDEGKISTDTYWNETGIILEDVHKADNMDNEKAKQNVKYNNRIKRTKNKSNKKPQSNKKNIDEETPVVTVSDALVEKMTSMVNLEDCSNFLEPFYPAQIKENFEEIASNAKEKEPPIKIVINKQKTRRKSKSFKKNELKGQNDLFEDFALVIKKPKRSITSIIAFTPADTFSKNVFPSCIQKSLGEHPPSSALAELDSSIEEMDMELDEIPFTSSIIERETNYFLQSAVETEDLNKPDDSIRDVTSLLLSEKDMSLSEFFEPKKRSTRSKSDAENRDTSPSKYKVESIIKPLENHLDTLNKIENSTIENLTELDTVKKDCEEETGVDKSMSKKSKKSKSKILKIATLDAVSQESMDINTGLDFPVTQLPPLQDNGIKSKRNRSKSITTPEVSIEEVKIVDDCSAISTVKELDKPKDVDSIYAFSESEDMEIEKPIGKPKKSSRKQTKSVCDVSQNIAVCDNVREIDLLSANCVDKSNKAKECEETKTNSLRRKSRSSIVSRESVSVDIKENDVDIQEERRKSMRSAKAKALENIHDDALAEFTECEKNRDVEDKAKVFPQIEAVISELQKIDKKQNGSQKLLDDHIVDQAQDIHELNKKVSETYVENQLNQNEIVSPVENDSVYQTKKKANKKSNKNQNVRKSLDAFQLKIDDEEKSLLLKDFAADLTGLEELENSIEKELNAEEDLTEQLKSKPKRTFSELKMLDLAVNDTENDSLKSETDNSHELRRSRRESRKIASYNENDLIDPLLDEIDRKRKIRKKEKAVIEELENKNQKKVKESEKKLNSDELFDLLKASTNENILEKSQSLPEDFCRNISQDTIKVDTPSPQKNGVENIYDFTESPESITQVKDGILSLDIAKKRNKKPYKSVVEENSESAFMSDNRNTIPSAPDVLELSFDSKTKSIKSEKGDSTDKSNYCEICNKKFIRTESLAKHKRTLTHIQKLSEIEAKEAALKSQSDQMIDDMSKTSNPIIEINSDSSKVIESFCKSDINIHDILQASDKSKQQEPSAEQTPFPNNHSLKLADIINDVLNKPVLESDGEKSKPNNFSDIIMQNDLHSEYRRYKSLGERKSFDSEAIETLPVLVESYESKTTILEKQISLLENIIENQAVANYIDDISMSSNNSLRNNELPSPSELSLKQDDSNTCSRINLTKPNASEDSFLKPSQYEEISEDSANLRSYEDQKARKALNRDEELFLECCSLLKSGSEMSSYSNKKSHNKVLNAMGLKQCDEPEWLERKSLVEKPLYDLAHDYSDNSRIPTPLGDSYDDDASNSNTISSNWNMSKKVSVFEDISQDKQEDMDESFTFQEILNEDCEEEKSKSISKFGGILSKAIGAVPKIIKRTPAVYAEELVEKKQGDQSDGGSTGEGKKIITKGARKVFEGLKVSIPTEELNLEEVLNCSPKSKKMDIANMQNSIEAGGQTLSSSKPLRTARKSKPVKNKSQFGSNLLFKMKKKKVTSPASLRNKNGDMKTHDIYDFEETQDNTDVFTKPDFRTFRNMKSNESVPEQESDTDSRDYMDSFSFEAPSITSSVSSSSSKKPKTQENITKKKCMIMGRIFKNAAKSKIEDIDEEIRDIPVIDNSDLVANYVADCKKIIKNEEVTKPKLTEKEINQLFDQLLEDKLTSSNKPKMELKKTETKKKPKQKNKKRIRTNSDSTDDEFSLTKTNKKRTYRKNAKAEDNCINLEQELKECIGVASRKSQRKCTSGKQNVLVEYWSSDESQFEALLETQRIETKQLVESESVVESTCEIVSVESKPLPPPKTERIYTEKKPQQKRKPSGEKKLKTATPGGQKTELTSNRRKRAAVNPLYHWSSSSEDESQDLIEVKPIRDEIEDDEDRPIQHGWIVGDSPKKLVTMLAQAKGKKTDIDCVKEQGKKRTNAVS